MLTISLTHMRRRLGTDDPRIRLRSEKMIHVPARYRDERVDSSHFLSRRRREGEFVRLSLRWTIFVALIVNGCSFPSTFSGEFLRAIFRPARKEGASKKKIPRKSFHTRKTKFGRINLTLNDTNAFWLKKTELLVLIRQIWFS